MYIKKYIVDSKMFEFDKHYRECVHHNHPFIKAKTNPVSGNYFVQIDLMPCDYHFSEEGKKQLKKLFENETKCKKPGNSSKPLSHDYSIDKELSWVDGIHHSNLNSFCENLYDLSQKYHISKSRI